MFCFNLLSDIVYCIEESCFFEMKCDVNIKENQSLFKLFFHFIRLIWLSSDSWVCHDGVVDAHLVESSVSIGQYKSVVRCLPTVQCVHMRDSGQIPNIQSPFLPVLDQTLPVTASIIKIANVIKQWHWLNMENIKKHYYYPCKTVYVSVQYTVIACSLHFGPHLCWYVHPITVCLSERQT